MRPRSGWYLFYPPQNTQSSQKPPFRLLTLIAIFCTCRYLLWADYLTTVQVKSTQINRPLPAPRQGGVPLPPQSPRLMVIALFRIHPLELVTCVPIDKNVRLV